MAKTKSKKKSDKTLPLALSLLESDHALVRRLFKEYEATDESADEERTTLIGRICSALAVHAQIEEEIFYPRLLEVLDEEDAELLREATIEHQHLQILIGELEAAASGDEMTAARMTVLSEYVQHHVEEEEDELFAKAQDVDGLDLDALGEEMQERKAELEDGDENADDEPASRERDPDDDDTADAEDADDADDADADDAETGAADADDDADGEADGEAEAGAGHEARAPFGKSPL
jgi:hemerythrin-like domain-containing protein